MASREKMGRSMGWIRDLSTGSKLALSFGVMAALILFAGFVGDLKSTRLNSSH